MYSWKNEKVVNNFLENTRRSIPLGAEQLDIMLRLLKMSQNDISCFIDLGAGDGILSRVILSEYPGAKGYLVDFSPAMVEEAKSKMTFHENIKIIESDLSSNYWQTNIMEQPEAIVSGFAIHHLEDQKKYTLYEQIYSMLKPGGIFINIEHVDSESRFGNLLFNELAIDTLYEMHLDDGKKTDKETLTKEFLARPDQYDNILKSVTHQCDWLREIGYIDVDCYFKCFELAIFAGLKKIN